MNHSAIAIANNNNNYIGSTSNKTARLSGFFSLSCSIELTGFIVHYHERNSGINKVSTKWRHSVLKFKDTTEETETIDCLNERKNIWRTKRLRFRVIKCWNRNKKRSKEPLQNKEMAFPFLKFLESPSFATKYKYYPSPILISVQSHAGSSIYDKWSTSLSQFCLFSRFCPVFTQDKSFFRRYVWRFVRSRQTICTCKMLMMTRNNSFGSAERP